MQDLQALVLASVLVNGDCGAVPIQVEQGRDPSPLGLKIDLVEGDRIATPFGMSDDGGIRVVNGVSLGKRNQPLAYWVQKTHPGEDDMAIAVGSRNFKRIRAHNPDGSRRFLHLYWQKRIGQTRGEPIFAPVLADFKDLKDWKEAELVAAQVAACFAVFITKENPFDAAVAAARGNTTADGEREEEVIPGQIYYGEAGESVTAVTPGRPTSLFEAFYGAVARQISSATGIPLEVAMRDFRDSNYSQSRAALLEARKCFAMRQTWLVRYFLQPIRERVLFEAWLRGRYDAGDFLARRALWTATTWNTPGWGHIDEEKSMKAAQLALEMRVTSRTRVASALHGGRWSAINRQLAREEKEIAELAGEEGGGGGGVAGLSSTEKAAALTSRANAYGIAVRSGALTPQVEDEEATRAEFGLPAMSAAAKEAWDGEPTRRPITLAPVADNPAVDDEDDEDDDEPIQPDPGDDAEPEDDDEETEDDDEETEDDEEESEDEPETE
jgi:lambda family phage portal protein